MAAKEKEAPALPEGQVEVPKKKSRIKRLVIILAILLMTLSGAGLGGYWWLYLRTPSTGAGAPAADAAGASAAAGQSSGSAPAAGQAGQGGQGASGTAASGGDARIERQSDLPRSGGMVLPLPAITVNLSDSAGRRYLKMSMEVEVNADVSAALQANNARIRD
ncbi:MAG: flagellar basal body protein FliL, partial [Desulfovibrio sp.]|nr:flagellar basal body protein FliL [Desulfovibrio sp.]